MSVPNRPINVRLPGELGRKFEQLRNEFGSLPPSVVLRLLVANELDKPFEQQVEVIMRQLRKPVQRKTKSALNAKNRITDS